jgi:Tol biopolymer transport system component
VAAWRGRELSAVAPNGRAAWTIAARGTVRDATWSPDGYRIAYRRDAVLAVVAGDGTGARILAQPVRAVAPAWRPGAPHTLAWVAASGRLEVRDVDSGARVWRSPARIGAVTALAWSADGHRLLARGERRVVVFDVTGKRSWRVRLPHGARVGAAAWAPRGDRIALALRRASATSVYVTRSALVPRRPVFTTTGTLGSLAWSPNGARLLVRWADADQWLLLSPSAADAPITAIGSISRRFRAPPTVQGWCCAG